MKFLFSKKLFLLSSLLLLALVFAGCTNSPIQTNPTAASNQLPANGTGLIGDIKGFALSAEETGFELSDYSELSPAGAEEEALASAGFESGYSIGFAKFDEENFERVVQQVTRYNTTQGALAAFEETKKVILQGNEVVAQLNVQGLGDAEFGAKGSRTVELGVRQATIDDYIIVFVKSNVLVAVDYFGLQESVSEEKAFELARKAAAKFA